jgi:hypothetical protein
MTALFLTANAVDACQLKLDEGLNPRAVLCYLVYNDISLDILPKFNVLGYECAN